MEDGDQQGEPADVIIDFTSPQALNKIIAAAEANGTPLVTGTTGFSSEDTARLRSLSAEVPVLASANFSFGIALMRRMLDDCGRLLIDNGFDCEIEEIHHRNKADAPSGTAKLLFDTLNANGTLTPVYGRCGTEARRSSGEVGIHDRSPADELEHVEKGEEQAALAAETHFSSFHVVYQCLAGTAEHHCNAFRCALYIV